MACNLDGSILIQHTRFVVIFLIFVQILWQTIWIVCHSFYYRKIIIVDVNSVCKSFCLCVCVCFLIMWKLFGTQLMMSCENCSLAWIYILCCAVLYSAIIIYPIVLRFVQNNFIIHHMYVVQHGAAQQMIRTHSLVSMSWTSFST